MGFSEVPDLVQIQRAQAGDRQAFDLVVKQYKGFLESLIRSELGARLKERVEVDDVIQDTFLRAFQSIQRFQGRTESSFRSWIASIARHVVQGQGRQPREKKAALARQVSLERGFPGNDGRLEELGAMLEGSAEPPSKTLRREERFERLKEALGALSPEHQEVIMLARVKGLAIKEVARRMGRTPGAASVLLWRAMVKLKVAFGSTESWRLPPRSLEEEAEKNDG